MSKIPQYISLKLNTTRKRGFFIALLVVLGLGTGAILILALFGVIGSGIKWTRNWLGTDADKFWIVLFAYLMISNLFSRISDAVKSLRDSNRDIARHLQSISSSLTTISSTLIQLRNMANRER